MTTASSSVTAFDVEAVRERFPALARTVSGVPVAYFDGPGGTQVPRSVVDAMAEYLLEHNANAHWRYATSRETDETIAAGRAALADLLNATPDEIAFGQNMTTLTFHVSRALSRSWGPGDEVVVTELDHHGNVDPWRRAALESGATVRTVPVTPDGELDGDASVFSDRTKLLAIGAASNAVGTIPDVKRLIARAHGAGALAYVDAVHAAPHVLTDVRDLDCDFLACSAYKFYGPHMGVLYGKKALLADLDVPKLRPAPESAPERLETGTQNHEAIAGAAAAVDFLASIGGAAATRRESLVRAYAMLHDAGELLLERMWNGLSEIDGVTLYGRRPGKPRTPTVAFTVDGVRSGDVAAALADRAVFVSDGNFYAATLVERLTGRSDGVVRAGCACYTTADEVDRLVGAVREIARA